MRYLTTYFRQQGEEAPSLLLYSFCYRNTPVCFACMCKVADATQKERSRILDLLQAWIEELDWAEYCSITKKKMETIYAQLVQYIYERLGNLADGRISLSIFLGIKTQILLYSRGKEFRFFLWNSAYGVGKLSGLPNLLLAEAEPGAGIIMCDFNQDEISKRESKKGKTKELDKRIGEGLRPWEIRTGELLKKHVNELTCSIEHKGNGVILMLTRFQQ